MSKRIIETVITAFIMTALTLLGGQLTGYWQTLAQASAFFRTSSGEIKAETTLQELYSSVRSVNEMRTEYGQVLTMLRTKIGECSVQDMNNKMSAMVSRRSPFKKGDKLLVENLSSEGSERVSVTVVGDFQPAINSELLIKVSQDAAQILNIHPGQTIRVEVKPE